MELLLNAYHCKLKKHILIYFVKQAQYSLTFRFQNQKTIGSNHSLKTYDNEVPFFVFMFSGHDSFQASPLHQHYILYVCIIK